MGEAGCWTRRREGFASVALCQWNTSGAGAVGLELGGRATSYAIGGATSRDLEWHSDAQWQLIGRPLH